MEKYEHIIPQKRHLADLPDRKRITICRHDIWINTPAFDDIFECIGYILETENQITASCISIIGTGGSGKSAVVKRLIDLNVLAEHKLKFVNLSENLDRYRLHHSVCEAFGVRFNVKSGDRTASVVRVIEAENVKGLVVDELHDALFQAYGQTGTTLSLMKNLSGDPCRLCLIVCGDLRTADVLGYDDQINRRFVRFLLPPWENDQNFTDFIAAYESHLPLKLPSNIADQRVRALLHAKSFGIMDNVVKIIKAFAMDAIATGVERIHEKQFQDISRITQRYGYQINEPQTKPKARKRK
ncbi:MULTISPECIES: TniB family NTP-binding protein [Pseudomonas]|uniref:TniB family NTP-binding protein n=1 Tax=Pseudomonas TaxID=286 RepID=UPI000675FF3E|nr:MULTISPECIES: TniB family NTP-binding protein [Pseudomonas]MBO2892840.1 TniB family NTP-binding protein [Pseudomonas asiatica]QUN70398.1 TniB family NTP-binding protein [Pseudomonas sp. JS425]